MSFTSGRDLLNKLTVLQLREIGKKHGIYIPSGTTKTGIISRLMFLPKSTIENEVKANAV